MRLRKRTVPKVGRAKKQEFGDEQLVSNLAKAIMDLVEYQVAAALSKKQENNQKISNQKFELE